MYLFLTVLGFLAVSDFSLAVASGVYSQLSCPGFSVCWLLLLQSMGSAGPVASVIAASRL